MEIFFVKIILFVLAAAGVVFGSIQYGKKSEAKKAVDSNNKVLNEHAKIDNTPDHPDPAGQL